MNEPHHFSAELFIWDAAAKATWFFLTVPADVSDALRLEAREPRGFGSIKVHARIGATTWATSAFPTTDPPGCFLLPVKKAVRAAEELEDGDRADVTLTSIG